MKIAIVGFGKIAHDAHAPAIEAVPGVELAAVVSSRDVGPPGVPQFKSLAELADSGVAVDAVSLCTRPVDRFGYADEALERGWHVMLEKPPAETLAQAQALVDKAQTKRRALMATWHARENDAVDRAAELLAATTVRSVDIVWHEDVDKWHPGQDWVWRPGGFGVFDPGINALSILTRIVMAPLRVTAATLTMPPGKPMPIKAHLAIAGDGIAITADFDWSPTPAETWEIGVAADGLDLRLVKGGATLMVNGALVLDAPHREYERLYARFATLCADTAIEADLEPLMLVEQAFATAG